MPRKSRQPTCSLVSAGSWRREAEDDITKPLPAVDVLCFGLERMGLVPGLAPGRGQNFTAWNALGLGTRGE